MEEDDLDEEPKSRCQSTIGGVEESMRQFAAEVRQADFKVQGYYQLMAELWTNSNVQHPLEEKIILIHNHQSSRHHYNILEGCDNLR
ncbi:hypothetical protein KIN20_037561 [Parelaphostrongylus tenuis]|uniref:Uncharacterized protein n=1 Tax=Parelaphostrongylus tenuis TaxID=148309 RepID=A0AAD5WM61_PARTN|nr:hypothetical protein KIN20_037561 [Parelaphostrongylus tenuis]